MLENKLLSIVRNGFPTSVIDDFKIEQPMVESAVGEMKWVQDVEIHDPRNVIHCMDIGTENDHTVKILLVLKKVPVVDPKRFHLVYVKQIEVLKEYTYEEWDRLLPEEIDVK
jgi:hypothetical protein